MAGKTLNEIIALEEEARRRVTQAIGSVLKGQRIEPDAAVNELDRMIAQQGERIAATKVAMERCITRFESEVQRREGRIRELEKLKARLGQGGVDRPTRGGRLQDVRGIGPVAAQRLMENGIDSLQTLAESAPEKVAEILDVDIDRARGFVDEARRRLTPG